MYETGMGIVVIIIVNVINVINVIYIYIDAITYIFIIISY